MNEQDPNKVAKKIVLKKTASALLMVEALAPCAITAMMPDKKSCPRPLPEIQAEVVSDAEAKRRRRAEKRMRHMKGDDR